MSSSQKTFRSVTLCFRGFSKAPHEIESLFGISASDMGVKGEHVRPGVKTILRRSFVRYSISFPEGCRLDEMIPELWRYLGGFENIRKNRDKINSEFIDLDIVLPVKNSEEQEGGFIANSTLYEVSNLGAVLSFQFL